MKRYSKIFFIAVVLLTFNKMVFAKDGAVNISILSDGTGNVGSTIASVRQIVGHAVGSGVVDNFIVIAPKEGGPIPIEGGLTACAEAGFGIVKNGSQAGLPTGFPVGVRNKFEVLVKQLRSIRPDRGVFLNIKLSDSCGISINPEDEFPTACGGLLGLSCPDSLICIDDPSDNCDPRNGGADCIGICVKPPVKR